MLLLEYKAKLELVSRQKISRKNLTLPQVYIAIINNSNEKVLAKVLSNLDLTNIENKLIINNKKFKFKYDKNTDLNIYFGLM